MSIAPRLPFLSFLIISGDMYIGVPVKLLFMPSPPPRLPALIAGVVASDGFVEGPRRERWIER